MGIQLQRGICYMMSKVSAHAAFLTLFTVSLLLSACAPTAELEKSREMRAQMTYRYSPISGDVYRLPPSGDQYSRAPMALPRDGHLSYSPFTNEPKVIVANHGRVMKANAPLPDSSELVASYSPLTGEAIWVTKR